MVPWMLHWLEEQLLQPQRGGTLAAITEEDIVSRSVCLTCVVNWLNSTCFISTFNSVFSTFCSSITIFLICVSWLLMLEFVRLGNFRRLSFHLAKMRLGLCSLGWRWESWIPCQLVLASWFLVFPAGVSFWILCQLVLPSGSWFFQLEVQSGKF